MHTSCSCPPSCWKQQGLKQHTQIAINYANIMGLQQSLGMRGQDFSWMATSTFIAYAVAEFPQGYLLQRFPVSKVLGCNVFMWGVTICCSAATRNFAGIVTLRVLLGVFEAVVAPALILITSQWYTKRQAAPRTGLWYCGAGVGQILGGLISWAAQHGSATAAFGSWRIMFVAIGVVNLAVAVALLLWLPDSVDNAPFLTDGQKEQIQATLAIDQAGNGRRIFQRAGLIEAVSDPALWLMVLIAILSVVPSGVIVTFSGTLIRGFGYSPKSAALLNMPSGVLTIMAVLVSTFGIVYGFSRCLSIVVLLSLTLIGAGLMSFYDGRAGALAGIYLINFTVAPLALVYSLVGSNTSGYTKKITSNVAIQIGFGIANIIGPQTFRSHEAPGYISAKITIFATNVAAIAAAIALRLVYGYRNRRTARERELQLEALARGEIPVQELVDEEDLSDLKNPAFRYVY